MEDVHMAEVVRAVGGTRAACPCGWVSTQTWPEIETGLQGCRAAGWAHAEAARRRTGRRVEVARTR